MERHINKIIETKITQLLLNSNFIDGMGLEGMTVKEQYDYLMECFNEEDIDEFYKEMLKWKIEMK